MEENVQKDVIADSNNQSTNEVKLSYEQLTKVANQLHFNLQQATKALEEARMGNFFKRLDYLMKVVELHQCFDLKFVDACIKEIQDSLTIPVTEEKEE